MFGHPKLVGLIQHRQRYEKWIIFGAFLLAVACYFIFKSAYPVLLVTLFIIVKRILCGKITLREGENIFIFGQQGSGKTLLLTKIAEDNKKNFVIAVNGELSHMKNKDLVLDKEELGLYDTGATAYFVDENSTDGFDNRSWSSNFNETNLDFVKKVRHYNSVLVFASQSFGEIDKKIREGCIAKTYCVSNHGFYSRADLLIKDEDSISELDGEVKVTYRYPTLLERIFDNSTSVYIPHKKYGKLCNSWFKKKLPAAPELIFNERFEASL